VKSAIYSGQVFHRRMLPKVHEFKYSDTMFYLDLSEIPGGGDGVLGRCAARFRLEDHFAGPGKKLEDAVRDLVESELGFRPLGGIRILTHIRQLGYVMNPVSFYYCWSQDDSRVEAIVAEVHNTPWGETHCYAFRFEEGERNEFRFRKNFHVSPFMAMDQEYVWRFDQPGDELLVLMENWEGAHMIFEARLSLQRQPLTEQTLSRILWKNPFLTMAVIARIYWQAGKLWMKRIPYFTHPRKALDEKVKR
jgi:uncharacterized protein